MTPIVESPDLIVDRVLQPISQFLENDSESAVLSNIDDVCTTVAYDIGNGLKQHPTWIDLGWFFGQYRGTILSGKRSFSKFYYSDRVGSEIENEYLLGIYWYAYSLGLTMGELFEQRCVTGEQALIDKKSMSEKNPWDVLVVSDKDQNFLTFTGRRVKNDTPKTYKLVIPTAWLNALIGDEIWSCAQKLISLPTPIDGDIKNKLEQEPGFSDLRYLLKSQRNLLLAQLLWGDDVNKTRNLIAAKALVCADDNYWVQFQKTTDEEILSQVLSSIQLLSLYWRYSKVKTKSYGPLVVCIPKPGKKNTKGLQPRFGFASLFVKGTARSVEKITINVLAPWERHLDRAAQNITTPKAKGLFSDARQRTLEMFGNDVGVELISKLQDLHLGGKNAVSLILVRILPLLAEIERAAPNFVHEGHRFATNILVGHEYHEQVIGECLGSVEDFLKDLKSKVPTRCNSNPDIEFRTDAMLFKTLAKSCYSLFDWDGVFLFARFNPDETKGTNFSSFRRLPESNSKLSTPKHCRFLTLRHNGLFAVSVDRGGTIRVYYGGKFILYKDKKGWKMGSAIETIEDKIRKGLDTIGAGIIPVKIDTLRSFAGLLLRISEEPGVGALFVVALKKDHAKRLSFIAEPPRQIWEDLRPFDTRRSGVDDEMEVLYRLAIMDGTTLITLGESGTPADKWAEAEIKPRRLVTEKFDMEWFWKEKLAEGSWGDWLDVFSYGAKHNSGLALALRSSIQKEPLLIIAVSSDGPINFMCGEWDPPIEKWPDENTSARVN